MIDNLLEKEKNIGGKSKFNKQNNAPLLLRKRFGGQSPGEDCPLFSFLQKLKRALILTSLKPLTELKTL